MCVPQALSGALETLSGALPDDDDKLFAEAAKLSVDQPSEVIDVSTVASFDLHLEAPSAVIQLSSEHTDAGVETLIASPTENNDHDKDLD